MTAAPVPGPEIAGRLREPLARANYTHGGLMVAFGGEVASTPTAVQARRLGDNDQAALARLFLLGLEVPVDRAQAALAPASLEELERAHVLNRSGDAVRSPLRIWPYEDLLVAHDPDTTGAKPPPDIVTGVNAAARTLASLTPRRSVHSALDIGTGCGVQALLVARDAGRVVATDVNPRALEFTRLNAALNGLENIDCREGSFYEPVAGERFDLIACNPPYVISPEHEYVFRDAGLGGDDVSRIAVTGAAEHLEESGSAHLLCNWIVDPLGHWSDRPRSWLEGSGCDVVLLHHASEDPLTYATRWTGLYPHSPDELGDVLDRWLDHYRDAGIATVATGAAALRRRAGAHQRLTTEEMATGPSGRGGDHVMRMFDAQELLGELTDDALLELKLVPVDGHRLAEERRYRNGGYEPGGGRLLLDDSAGVQAEVGFGISPLLAAMDGSRTVAELAAAFGRALGVEPEQATGAVVTTVRALLRSGFIARA